MSARFSLWRRGDTLCRHSYQVVLFCRRSPVLLATAVTFVVVLPSLVLRDAGYHGSALQPHRMSPKLHNSQLHWPSPRQPSRPSPRPTVILPLGDSITDGGTKLRSYRYHLGKLLERAGHHCAWAGSLSGVYDRRHGENVTTGILWRTPADWPAVAQAHEGHWGWTAQQILSGNDLQPQRGRLGQWLQQRAVVAPPLLPTSPLHKESQGSTYSGIHADSMVPPWPDVPLVQSSRIHADSTVPPWPDVALVHLGTNDLTQSVFLLHDDVQVHLRPSGRGPLPRCP